jgi:hypothetical protein
MYNRQLEEKMTPEREAAATGSWHRTLAGIPTLLGRIAYLASLRDINTDTYQHFGLAQRIGDSDADQILSRSHREAFHEWLCLGLQRQKQELSEYFAGLEDDPRKVLHNWLKLAPYKTWVPPDSRDVERELFYTDLGIVLEVLRADYGVAARDPDS